MSSIEIVVIGVMTPITTIIPAERRAVNGQRDGVFPRAKRKTGELAGRGSGGLKQDSFFPQGGADPLIAFFGGAGQGVQVDAAGEGGEGRGSLPGNAFQKFVCVVAGENVQLTAQLAVHGVLRAPPLSTTV